MMIFWVALSVWSAKKWPASKVALIVRMLVILAVLILKGTSPGGASAWKELREHQGRA